MPTLYDTFNNTLKVSAQIHAQTPADSILSKNTPTNDDAMILWDDYNWSDNDLDEGNQSKKCQVLHKNSF